MKSLQAIPLLFAIVIGGLFSYCSGKSNQAEPPATPPSESVVSYLECESSYMLETEITLHPALYMYRNHTCVYAGGIGSIIEVESNIGNGGEGDEIRVTTRNKQPDRSVDSFNEFNYGACKQIYSEEEIVSWEDWKPVCALNLAELKMEYCGGQIFLTENGALEPFCSYSVGACVLKFEFNPDTEETLLLIREKCDGTDWSCCGPDHLP